MFARVLFTGRVLLPGDLLQFVYPWRSTAPAGAAFHNPAISDSIEYFYPYQKYFRDALLHHRVPLWNPHQSAGQPFAATGQIGVFYPVNALLTAALPAEDFFGPSAALHCILAGLFMFLMLRGFRCRFEAALAGAVAYMFSGWLVVWTAFPPFLSAAAWAPLVILFLELALRRGSWRLSCAAGAALGIDLLTGNPQVTAYVLLAAALLAAGHAAAPEKKLSAFKRFAIPAGMFALMATVGLLVGAVQVLPTLDLISQSSRPASNAGLLFQTGIKPHHLITFFMPDFFGNPASGRYLFKAGVYVTSTAYPGIAAVLLACMAFALRRDRASAVWTAAAALGVSGALGLAFVRPLFHLPGFNMLHVHRMLFLCALAGPALAALAWDALLKRDDQRKRKGGWIVFVTAAFAAAAIVAATVILWNYSVRKLGLNPEKVSAFEGPASLRFILVLAAAIGAIALRRVSRGFASALLVIVIAADLMTWGFNFNTAGDRNLVYPKTKSTEYLTTYRQCRIQGLHEILFPDSATVFGFEDIRGYEPLGLARYAELMRSATRETTGTDPGYSAVVSTNDYNRPLLDLLNVCLVLSMRELKADNLSAVYSDDIIIYLNRRALTRAAFFDRWRVERNPEKIRDEVVSFDFRPAEELLLEKSPGFEPSAESNGGVAGIERYEPEKITIKVEAYSPGLVFVSDAMARGWEARVDGRPAELLAADYAFRAVPVSKGRHRVVMRYRPLSVRAGALLSLIALAASVFVLTIGLVHFQKE